MFAVTIDQKNSRQGPDRVPELLKALRAVRSRLRFERTAGDEIQALLDDPAQVVQTVLITMRSAGWSIGIGVGPVREPLPKSTREASGAAFIAAREAVEAAKGRPKDAAIRVLAAEPAEQSWSEQAEGVLALLARLVSHRSAAEWRVVDAYAASPERTLSEVAETLGISHQAVSQALNRTGWRQELAAAPGAATLLDLADR